MPRFDTAGGIRRKWVKLQNKAVCMRCLRVMQPGEWAQQLGPMVYWHINGSYTGISYDECPNSGKPSYWQAKRFGDYLTDRMMEARNNGEYTQAHDILGDGGRVVGHYVDPRQQELEDRFAFEACRKFGMKDPRWKKQ